TVRGGLRSHMFRICTATLGNGYRSALGRVLECGHSRTKRRAPALGSGLDRTPLRLRNTEACRGDDCHHACPATCNPSARQHSRCPGPAGPLQSGRFLCGSPRARGRPAAITSTRRCWMITDSRRFQPFTEQPISLVSEQGEWIAPFELDLDDEE